MRELIRTTQREETNAVLENLGNTIYGAAADLRKLKKENATLKARIAELELKLHKTFNTNQA